jgi:D-galactarolactone cycloisomerase
MEGYRALGLTGCKFKVGGKSPAEDAERTAAARAAGGEDFVLAVDANRGWPRAAALEFARRAAKLNLRWFEEPCHWTTIAATWRCCAPSRAFRSSPANPRSARKPAAT